MIMALIYRNVPRKKTNELLLLGEQISAAEAERIGIVNRVFAPEEFDAGVREWAEKLARKSPLLMKLGKDAMFRQQDMAFLDALDFLRSQLTIAFSTEDIQEGVNAFFEKREPSGRGGEHQPAAPAGGRSGGPTRADQARRRDRRRSQRSTRPTS